MPSKAVSDAVDAYLAANFSTRPVYAVNEQMDPPPDGGSYVQVQYPIALELQQSIGAPGANWFREEGAIRFVIVAPAGSGSGSAMTLADELRGLFRNKRFDGVRTYEAQPVTIDDQSDQPGSFVASFAVAYEYDITA